LWLSSQAYLTTVQLQTIDLLIEIVMAVIVMHMVTVIVYDYDQQTNSSIGKFLSCTTTDKPLKLDYPKVEFLK